MFLAQILSFKFDGTNFARQISTACNFPDMIPNQTQPASMESPFNQLSNGAKFIHFRGVLRKLYNS